jgi:hypothetical protein
MITTQEVFHEFFPVYKQENAIAQHQTKVSVDIMECRTAALGGNSMQCDECGHVVVHYNSCRNRHCSLCQRIEKEVWVDNRYKDVINAPYFHLVFTMPDLLRQIIYQNQKILYNLMYKAAAETIKELALDSKYLGAQVGFFSLLHTWAQDLHYHPHIHTVVMAGGLTKLNKWCSSSKEFFIPVKVLAKKFCGKYLYFLRQYYQDKKLNFYKNTLVYEEPEAFYHLIKQCYDKSWYTYVKETFSGPADVIKYLGRYTHQVAIANNRILSLDERTVIFTARDKKRTGELKKITLKGAEFIRRFLMHVLPKGFVKIRYYGILANTNKKTKLELCRKLTNSILRKPLFAGLSIIEILNTLTGRDVTICLKCGIGNLQSAGILIRCVAPT